MLRNNLENETEPVEEEKPTLQNRRKVVYLEDDVEPIDTMFRLSKTQYETLKEKAREKGVSMASYVREALIKSFTSDIPEETKNKISQLLQDCFSEDIFEIEGKEGFLNQVAERDLTGEIWTPEQLDNVAECLIVGWKGYFIPPDPDDLLKRFSEAMKLDKTQKDYLEQKVTEILEEHHFTTQDEW